MKCSVVIFRNVADRPHTFASFAEVKAHLTSLSAACDGGTDIGRLLLQVISTCIFNFESMCLPECVCTVYIFYAVLKGLSSRVLYSAF